MSEERKDRVCCLCGKQIEKDEKTVHLLYSFLKEHVDFKDTMNFQNTNRLYTYAHYSCVEEKAGRWHKQWYSSMSTQENPWLKYLPKDFMHECMQKYIRNHLMCYYCRKYIGDKRDAVYVRIKRRIRVAHKSCFGCTTLLKWTNK